MSVSAVVVSFFTGPLLARAIASLRAQPDIGEIILVDNGNWPGAIDAAIAQSAGVAVRVLTGHGNVGFATGCNLGARAAQGAGLLLFNPDAEMPDGGVARLIADSAALKRPIVMGPRLMGPDGREQRGSRRMALTPWRAFVEAARLDRLAPGHPYFRRFNLHETPCPDDVAPVPVLSGACLYLAREDYFAIGGMDEAYFLHVEDVDFCLRFSAAGGQVLFNPHVEVRHAKSASRADAMRVERRKTQSTILYFRRHFSRAYPPPFLTLVAALLWAQFGAKALRRSIERGMKLVGRGPLVADRARAIAKRRDARQDDQSAISNK